MMRTSVARTQPVLPFGRIGSRTSYQSSTLSCTRNTWFTGRSGSSFTNHGLGSCSAGRSASRGVSKIWILGTTASATSDTYGGSVVVVVVDDVAPRDSSLGRLDSPEQPT